MDFLIGTDIGKRKLLILDLDETLLFATETPLQFRPDFACASYSVYKRPHVDTFLDFAFQTFRVAIWTTSGEQYAACVVNNLFAALSAQLLFVWSRSRCVARFDEDSQERFFVKDLRKVKRKGYNLREVIVVDDTPEKLCRNYGNLVQVAPFEGDPHDDELVALRGYLAELAKSENVRTVDKRSWRGRC